MLSPLLRTGDMTFNFLFNLRLTSFRFTLSFLSLQTPYTLATHHRQPLPGLFDYPRGSPMMPRVALRKLYSRRILYRRPSSLGQKFRLTHGLLHRKRGNHPPSTVQEANSKALQQVLRLYFPLGHRGTDLAISQTMNPTKLPCKGDAALVPL